MALNRLAEFLAADASKEWEWAEHDCGLRLADWAALALGIPDPAAHLRGTYTEATAPNLLKTVRDITRRLGLQRTREPRPGDIGIIEIEGMTPRYVSGAIHGAIGWTVPNGRGLTCLRSEQVRIIAAWRVPQCRS